MICGPIKAVVLGYFLSIGIITPIEMDPHTVRLIAYLDPGSAMGSIRLRLKRTSHVADLY